MNLRRTYVQKKTKLSHPEPGTTIEMNKTKKKKNVATAANHRLPQHQHLDRCKSFIILER
jgi:hypothetical protein